MKKLFLFGFVLVSFLVAAFSVSADGSGPVCGCGGGVFNCCNVVVDDCEHYRWCGGDGSCNLGGKVDQNCGAVPAPVCGNGNCEENLGENPWSCPEDCAVPAPVCGDGACDSGDGENPWSCPQDCAPVVPQCGCGSGAANNCCNVVVDGCEHYRWCGDDGSCNVGGKVDANCGAAPSCAAESWSCSGAYTKKHVTANCGGEEYFSDGGSKDCGSGQSCRRTCQDFGNSDVRWADCSCPPAPRECDELWGSCGSCDSCGHAGECVLRNKKDCTSECLWDPSKCAPAPPQPSPVCGDGSCNGVESCGSCPADCGSCPVAAPVAGVSGPSVGFVGDSLTYAASVSGSGLTKSALWVAAADLRSPYPYACAGGLGGAGNSWCLVAKREGISGDGVSYSGVFVPPAAGSFMVIVNGEGSGGRCSGNPVLASGWVDCGPNDNVVVVVSAAPVVCRDGDIQSQSCGNCGSQARACVGGQWGSWSGCRGEGVCSPGVQESQSCGFGGIKTRTCADSCGWSSWSDCQSPGVCSPGDTQADSCGNCGAKVRACQADYQWGSWSGCRGEGVCSPGVQESQQCGYGNTGSQSRSCSNSCSWSAFGDCNGVNNPPVLASIGNKTVREGELLQFNVSGSDPENQPLQFTVLGLPVGAVFDSVTRMFSWIPSYVQAGVYKLTVMVSDGIFTDLENVTINVLNVFEPEPSKSEPRPFISSGRDAVYLDSAFVAECVEPGDQLAVGVDLTSERDLHGIQVSAVVQELNIKRAVGPFNVDGGDDAVKKLFLDVPEDAAGGKYYARITVSNDLFSRVKFREFTVASACGSVQGV